MKKGIFLVLSIILILSSLFVACGGGTTTVTTTATATATATKTTTATATPTTTVTELPRDQTLYISGAAWGPASTWNPFQPGSLANTTGTVGFVYETLFDFDPLMGDFIPWLAQSGTWTNDTTYDIVLRSGLTWSDGQALTATDVAFTFELGHTNAALWFAPVWSYLTSVTAVDATHVRFAFTNPLYQEWDYYLYRIPIVPKHLWQNRSADDVNTGANEKPVGSGAYLYMATGTDRNIWQRNENWWGISVFGKPAPKYIVDIRTSSNNVALGMVIKGELDLSNNFLPGVAELANKGYVKTYFAGPPYMLSANTAVLFLNTTKQPMDDAAFRRALAFAIDVPSIVNVAYAQLVKASSPTGLLPSLSQFDDQSVLASLGYSYNKAKAIQMLADAGYEDINGDGFVEAPDGSAISLQVTCPNGWTDWMAAIDIISSSAKAAGINIESAYPDYGAWNTALQGGTFDMTLNNWAAMSNTPWTLYNLLFRHPIVDQMQNGNFGRYNNQQMFDLVDALARVKVTDITGMKAACKAIQQLMLTDMPMIPLWYNGLWAQFSDSTWKGWPTEDSAEPTLPTTWSDYWQMGGLMTLINLTPASP